MIVLQLSRAANETFGPRDHEWQIGDDIRGVAIARESLTTLLTPDELERFPNWSVFYVTMGGGNLRASCAPKIPLTVDGTPIVPMHHHVLKDRGTLTLLGMTFIYTVKYV